MPFSGVGHRLVRHVGVVMRAGHQPGRAIFRRELAHRPEDVGGRVDRVVTVERLVALARLGRASGDGRQAEIAAQDVVHGREPLGMEEAHVENRVLVDERAQPGRAFFQVEVLARVLALLGGEGVEPGGHGGGLCGGQQAGHDEVAIAVQAGAFVVGQAARTGPERG